MYSYFEGNLIEKTPTYAVIECGGIGYMINISLITFTKIKDATKCRLYTHLTVREDAHILYGFYDENERTLFRHLISVSGIGPNTARMMLSSLSADEIIQAILLGNVSLIQTIKGIGAKSAQRIILDLKDKLGKITFDSENFSTSHNTKREEALSALVMLGFNKTVAEKTLDKIIRSEDANATVEQLIKSALKIL